MNYPRVMSQSQIDNIIAKNIRTSDGRQVIAQSLLEPFKLGRDYMSIGRKILDTDILPPGAPIWYDKDPQFTAVVLGEDGTVPYEVIKGERVYQDPFTIAVLVRIPVEEVAYRRFNVIDREQKKGRIEMGKMEDQKIFAALSAAGQSATGHNQVVNSTSGLTRGTVLDLTTTLADINAPTMAFVMHPRHHRDILAWGHNDFDPITRLEIKKTGYVGDLYGTAVRTSFLVPYTAGVNPTAGTGEVYAISEPNLTGVVSIRIDLDVWDSPDPQKLHYGWVFFELLSILIVQAKGVACATISGKVS